MLLLNLVLQIVLTLCSYRRKFKNKLLDRVFIWSAYISTDSVTTVALGVISSKLGDVGSTTNGTLDERSKLMAFWAPSLLFLLGGPDTITAYALEDNELWLRHFLGLVVQTSVTGYIYLVAWSVSDLTLLSFFMLVAAFNKYAERVWALWLASAEKFRESMLAPPDPSPNYPRFMEEYVLKQDEGYIVKVHEVVERAVLDDTTAFSSSVPEVEARSLLRIFKRLFVDLILSDDDRRQSLLLFKGKDADAAYSIIAIELGFMYDMLYTKAMVLQSNWGLWRRLITSSVSILVLVLFSHSKKPHYPTIDLVLTYMFLASIVFLELYSVLLLSSSDWITVWLAKEQGSRHFLLRFIIRSLRLFKRWWFDQPRWSDCAGQLKFLRFCVRCKSLPCQNILRRLHLLDKTEKYYYTSHKTVRDGPVKLEIFNNLKKKFEIQQEKERASEIRREEKKKLEVQQEKEKELAIDQGKEKEFTEKQDKEVERKEDDDDDFKFKYDLKSSLRSILTDAKLNKGFIEDDLNWCLELEFDQCILVWHIATELCYYVPSDVNPPKPEEANPDRDRSADRQNSEEANPDDDQVADKLKAEKASPDQDRAVAILLSRYMFYLLVRYPTMLPSGIGQIRLRDTLAEAVKFFEERSEPEQPRTSISKRTCWQNFLRSLFDRSEISKNKQANEEKIHGESCKILLQVDTQVPPSMVKGGRTKSVLFDGSRLAKALNKRDVNRRWKLISNVWIEILYYAASQSEGNCHAQQLRRGGELLTHVWLMMAHFGLTDHFQMTENHAIADISLK